MECNYKDDKKEGVAKIYDNNNILLFELTFINDKLNGIAKSYKDDKYEIIKKN
jgi:antitoxin component YwqK of YwqJK toxin-antitoxin module